MSKTCVILKEKIVVNTIILDEDYDQKIIDFAINLEDANDSVIVDDEVVAYIGGIYEDGVFYPPKIKEDWIWNPVEKSWQPPMPSSENGNDFKWDQELMEWIPNE